jgi:hypothetical protein
MKKLIAGLIIVLLLGGILGIVPNMAYADPPGGGYTSGIPQPPPQGRTDGSGCVVNNGIPQPPPQGR